MVYGCGAGHGANVEQDTDIGLEDGAKGVEEPLVRVDFFFFEAEDEDWDDAAFVAFQFKSGSYGDLKKETSEKGNDRKRETNFEWYISRNVLFSNLCLRHALLVDTHGSNDAQRPRIDLSSAITHNTHDDFLPPFLAPSFAPLG